MSRMIGFRDGTAMPAISFGTGTTFKGRHDSVVDSVKIGWKCGYRNFDTASFYKTEKALGQALHQIINEGADRRDIFLATKVDPFATNYDAVIKSANESMEALGVDYLDLLLLHQPGIFVKEEFMKQIFSPDELLKVPQTKEALESSRIDQWCAMQDLKKSGKVRHIGISNFTRGHIEALIKDPRCSEVPEVNQIEIHPYLFDTDIIKCCQKNGIIVQAFGPLGNGKLPNKPFCRVDNIQYVLDDPVIQEVAKCSDCSPAQVCLAWLLQKGITVVIKSENEKRLMENIQAVEVHLSELNMKKIDDISYNQRIFLDPYQIQ